MLNEVAANKLSQGQETVYPQQLRAQEGLTSLAYSINLSTEHIAPQCTLVCRISASTPSTPNGWAVVALVIITGWQESFLSPSRTDVLLWMTSSHPGDRALTWETTVHA